MKLSRYPTILLCLITFIANANGSHSDDDGEDQGTSNAEFNVRRENIIQNAQGVGGNFFRTLSQSDMSRLKKFNYAKMNAVFGMTDNCDSEEIPEPNPSRSQTPPPLTERLEKAPGSPGVATAKSTLHLNDSNRVIVAISITWVSLAFLYFQLCDWGWL